LVLIFFTSCTNDDYITQTYNKDLVSKKFTCLKLHLSPYSSKTINTVKSLYTFNDTCNNTLEIKYKSKIACNSKYNTNKQFNSFVQLSILKDNKLIYVVYKDLKEDANINEEIKKGYKKLCQTIKL